MQLIFYPINTITKYKLFNSIEILNVENELYYENVKMMPMMK